MGVSGDLLSPQATVTVSAMSEAMMTEVLDCMAGLPLRVLQMIARRGIANGVVCVHAK